MIKTSEKLSASQSSFTGLFVCLARNGVMEKVSSTFLEAVEQVFAATRRIRLVAVWDSAVLVAREGFLKWSYLERSANIPSNTKLYLWVRYPGSSNSSWQGPYLNTINEIPAGEESIQVRAALYSDGWPDDPAPTPLLSSLSAKCLVTGDDGVFCSSVLDLGFNPVRALITYNAEVPEGTVIQAAISNRDSADLEDYQVIDLNTITELTSLPIGEKVAKIMIQVAGRSDVPVDIRGFSIAIGGPIEAR